MYPNGGYPNLNLTTTSGVHGEGAYHLIRVVTALCALRTGKLNFLRAPVFMSGLVIAARVPPAAYASSKCGIVRHCRSPKMLEPEDAHRARRRSLFLGFGAVERLQDDESRRTTYAVPRGVVTTCYWGGSCHRRLRGGL
jgi:hypothetical protein